MGPCSPQAFVTVHCFHFAGAAHGDRGTGPGYAIGSGIFDDPEVQPDSIDSILRDASDLPLPDASVLQQRAMMQRRGLPTPTD